MHITEIHCREYTVRIPRPLELAQGTLEYCVSVLVRIETDQGIIGWGEAAPDLDVTGETQKSVMAAIELFRPVLLGLDPARIALAHSRMNSVCTGNPSAKAAVDMALHDILGKAAGLPLWKLLGGFRREIRSDMTIGFGTPERMAADARAYTAEGFTTLKVKTGMGLQRDVEGLRAIRAAAGPQTRIRIDANEAWSRQDAIRTLKALEPFDILEAEQPVPGWDLEGLSYVRSRSGIPIMADESLHSLQDALKLTRAVDRFNIKLMKCGGIYPAMQILAVAESAGISCIVGCMMETALGIAASAAVCCASGAVTDCDLDSFLLFDTPEIIPGFSYEGGGRIRLGDRPGLGVAVTL